MTFNELRCFVRGIRAVEELVEEEVVEEGVGEKEVVEEVERACLQVATKDQKWGKFGV